MSTTELYWEHKLRIDQFLDELVKRRPDVAMCLLDKQFTLGFGDWLWISGTGEERKACGCLVGETLLCMTPAVEVDALIDRWENRLSMEAFSLVPHAVADMLGISRKLVTDAGCKTSHEQDHLEDRYQLDKSDAIRELTNYIHEAIRTRLEDTAREVAVLDIVLSAPESPQ